MRLKQGDEVVAKTEWANARWRWPGTLLGPKVVGPVIQVYTRSSDDSRIGTGEWSLASSSWRVG